MEPTVASADFADRTRTAPTRLTPLGEPALATPPLPVPLNPLVGRETEIAAAVALLRDPTVRLVTFTGPGGVGKTRLALAVATELSAAFPDGVVWVPLASVADPDLVLPTLAGVLGLRGDERDPAERLAAVLRGRRLLLGLDNLEQVVAVAPRLADFLIACAEPKLLTTSRVALGIRGEREFAVPPLTLPRREGEEAGRREGVDSLLASQPDRLLDSSEAVRLFVQAARGRNPGFALTEANAAAIAEICVRIEGLPLAIELAAARTRLLPIPALLRLLDQRLELLTGGPRDLPDRQRTLRDTIAWSYDLLAPEDQARLRHLAVFAGSFELEAAAAVTGTDVYSLLDALGTLVDHHLVRPTPTAAGEPRFQLLETIRDFALERLTAAGEADDAREAHAAWFLALAERAESHLHGADQTGWLDRLEADHADLRAALAWAIERSPARPDAHLALRLTGALWPFWEVRGYLGEGRGWLDRALAKAASAPAAVRAKALSGAGRLAERQGDAAAARRCHEAALAAWREAGDPARQAKTLSSLGNVSVDLGELDRAEALHAEALAHYETAGSPTDRAAALVNLGGVAYYRGDYGRAETVWQEAAAAFRATGEARNEAIVLNNLGALAVQRGDAAAAIALHEASLAVRRRVGDKNGIAASLANLGGAYQLAGDRERAAAFYEEAATRFRELGHRHDIAIALFNLGTLATGRGEHDRALTFLVESAELFMAAGDRVALAACLEALGAAALGRGWAERAVRLLGTGAALREATGAAREASQQDSFDRTVATARSRLEAAAFDAALAAGGALPPDRAVAEAVALTYLPAGEPAAPAPAATTAPHGLTRRELEVLSFLVRRATDREIAEALFVSPRTVSTHVTAILNKLGVSSRHEAAAAAVRLGLG